MNKVYVVQRQLRWDEERENLLPKFDLTPAEKFGELEYLLGPKDTPFTSEQVIKDLHHKLSYLSKDDYILLVGNPCLIGWAVAIASQYNNGVVRLLQWCNRTHTYVEILTDLKKTT